MPTESELPPGRHRSLLEAVHEVYRNGGCPGTRKISATAREASFAADVISHQAVANVLHGKSFPVWVKLQALVAALLILGRSESIKPELERFRALWVDAHYVETGSEPPLVRVVDESMHRPRPGRQPDPLAEASTPSGSTAPEPEVPLAAQSVPEGDVASTSAPAPTVSSGDDSSTDHGFGAVFMEAAWPGPEMFSVKHTRNGLVVTLNVAHPMGASIAEAMERDEETSRTLWMLLLSWARMEDEIPFAKKRLRVEELRRDWSRYAGLFMERANEAE